MPLSWNEIRDRSLRFSKEWENEESEDAEAKSFWDGFFNIFDLSRRRMASFEQRVKKIDGKDGFIDLLWKGVLLIEHKSKGKDLDRAYAQAKEYFPGLKERDLPRYILVSDFARFRLYDLETNEQHEFLLGDLYKHVKLFGFIAGYQTHSVKPEDPANIKAAELMGKLHDQLKSVGYDGHVLEVYLVRLLFCLFAEDTSIFERQQFSEYIEIKTAEDGHDLAHHLSSLFYILNTPEDKRLKNLDEHLAAFPYVNGKLFEEALPPASFDTKMRQTLLDCSALDWSLISPAIFGSLFQSVMDEKLRRNLGAHYTTEQNILKALQPLFLNKLHAELEKVKRDSKKLLAFHKSLSAINIFDPACGCGNFLVIAYRELRLLELDILREMHKTNKGAFLDIGHILFVDVDQFFGIEIEEFPAQIAQVALWLTDHQMNMRVSQEFGQYFARLPLKRAPNIVHGNALAIAWQDVINPERCTYVVGNPPFVGKHLQSDEQKEELLSVFHGVKGAGVLDYVTCWHRKAVDYMDGNKAIRTAFVSTNSISQGEQPGVLWPELFRFGAKIHFAHRTFQWSSEARGKAAVHCIIIGFALQDTTDKWLFDYETPQGEPHAIKASNINPYLIDFDDLVLQNLTNTICAVPPIIYGSKPADGGHLLLSQEEKDQLVANEPASEAWIRPFIGADEFLYNLPRYCLWLVDCPPNILRTMPLVRARVEKVKAMRAASKKAPTRELATTPNLFAEIRQPKSNYLLVPAHTGESRRYIPFGNMSSDYICSNANFLIPNTTIYHFGILSSHMHMAWVRTVCGRLESRFRYSAGIVYNNFPWCDPSDKQKRVIEVAAQTVLDIRAKYKDSTLADLYDPLAMPSDLVTAHRALDKAVDAAYGKKSFSSEAERVAFLFLRYQELTSLMPIAKAVKRRPKKANLAS
ncbi:MAG: class I SAM-dependent DNA methyltransferase [Methylophilaceae bacterium]|nr:MAG: class I SAM-dependent DNA methyltransferase [Methylophilaceae bacterium]